MFDPTEIHTLVAQRRRLLRVVAATTLATAAAAVVALVAALDSAAARDAAPAAAEIVFTRHVHGSDRADVWAVNADGSGLRRLTRDGTSGDATFSPDGRRIVFASGRAHGAHAPELHVMDVDGRNVRRLTHSTEAPRAFWQNTQPAWSPDGKSVIFVRTRVRGETETTDLWRVPSAGGAPPVRLTRAAGREANPAFAPDGALGFDRDGWVRRLGPAGLGNVRPGADPAWSPDGSYLAFVGDDGIYVTLGQSARLVAPGGSAPAWSPDGSRLVYRAAGGGLEAVTLRGLARQRLTPASTRTADIAPAWRPARRAQSRSIASPNE